MTMTATVTAADVVARLDLGEMADRVEIVPWGGEAVVMLTAPGVSVGQLYVVLRDLARLGLYVGADPIGPDEALVDDMPEPGDGWTLWLVHDGNTVETQDLIVLAPCPVDLWPVMEPDPATY